MATRSKAASASKTSNKGLIIAGLLGVTAVVGFKLMSSGVTSVPDTSPTMPNNFDADGSSPGSGSNTSTSTAITTTARKVANKVTSTASKAVNTVKRVIAQQLWKPATWPLQKGQKGDIIGKLQVALKAISKDPSFIADGMFGDKTAAMLTKLGYSQIVNKTLYQQILTRSNPKVKQANESKEAYLIRVGYPQNIVNDAKRLGLLIRTNIPSATAVNQIIGGHRSSGAIREIVKAYQFLYGTNPANDMASRPNGSLIYANAINLLRANTLMGLGNTEANVILLTSGSPLKARINTIVRRRGSNERGTTTRTVTKDTIVGNYVSEKNGVTYYQTSDGAQEAIPTADVVIAA